VKNSYTELDPKPTDGIVDYSGSQTYGQMGRAVGRTDGWTDVISTLGVLVYIVKSA